MKRSSRATWIVLALIVVGLCLLIDPAGWFAGEEQAVDLGHVASGGQPTGDAPAAEHADELDAPAGASRQAADPATSREELDPGLAAGTATLRVLDSADRPVAGAQLLVVRDEALLANARTDEQGELALAADAQPAGLVIALPQRPPEWHDVVLDAGCQDVHLHTGARLAGRLVLEDGGSPGSLHVNLVSDHSPSSLPELPACVGEALTGRTLLSAYAAFDTDEEGAFELAGLPESWRGYLRLRSGWKAVSTTDGELEASARGVRFSEPATEVVVVVARQPSLRGRLVRRADGSPLTGAQLCALLRSPDAQTPTITSATTDADGLFELRCPEERLDELDLRLGASFRSSPPLLRLTGTELPADGELGDVVVDGARHVPFLLRDPAGLPIAGGVAVAAGVRSVRTGKDGRGELRWLARAVERLVAEASGYVPTSAELPAVVVEPLVVTLEPANSLLVRLLLPEGSDPTQFKVVLRGEGRITACPAESAADQDRHLSERAIHILDFTGEAKDAYLCAGVAAETGTATFHALRPGAELELEVQGRTGERVYHAESVLPLAPAEQRLVVVSLEAGLIPFRGRILDEDGGPLAMAVVQLGGQILAWTGDDGSFECFLAGPETGTLLLQHGACTTRYLHDYTVPTDGVPVEFRLQPARRLTIEVVDEQGTPMPQAEIYTEYGGFITNTHRIEGHRHYASSMPEGPFVIQTRLAGRIYRQDHDPAEPEARVVVPVHGRVVARIDAATTARRGGRFLLILATPADEEVVVLVESRDSAPNLRVPISAALPGTYEATLRYEPSAAEAQAGRTEEESHAVTIVVVAGEETVVPLALPPAGG